MLSKRCILIWSEKLLVNKKGKDPAPWTYVIGELFVNKNCKKNQSLEFKE